MPRAILLVACFLLYESLLTSSTSESTITYFTLNCSGEPLDLDIWCDRECIANKIPSAKLDEGASPLDGLVGLESDRLVCYDGFNILAAELVCRELGFPAVKDYSPQMISRTGTSNKTHWLSYSAGCQSAGVKDCLSQGTKCLSNTTVRLTCREPGFLGCYQGDRDAFQTLYVSGFKVHSNEECVSTCRVKTRSYDKAVSDGKNCRCYGPEEYNNNFFSSLSSTHSWTPAGSSKQVHCFYNLSVGVCEHPGPVSDGYWDSNISSFGSEITLTCDEGFMLYGSATLQCVGLPGWSTYFPDWNASVPSCRAVENATNGIERNDTLIYTTPPQIIDDSTSMSNITAELYILGTLLFVIVILLVVLALAWHKNHKERRMPLRAANQLLQMSPVNTSNRRPSSADHVELNTTGTDAGAEDQPFQNHPNHTFTDATAHEEDSYIIYQNAAKVAKGAAHPSRVDRISPRASSSQNNISTTVSTSLPSVNIPYIQDRNYNSMQETSIDQTKSGCEDCAYEVVDLHRNNGVKEIAPRSPGEVRLFDDACYNSLTFGNRFDSACAQTYYCQGQDSRIATVSNGKGEMDNECEKSCKSGDFSKSRNNDYDHTNHAFHDDKAQVHHLAHSSVCLTLQPDLHSRRENIPSSNMGSPATEPSGDVCSYQLYQLIPEDIDSSNRPCHPDVFDSSEYILLNPGKESVDCLLPAVREFNNVGERQEPDKRETTVYPRVHEKIGTALAPKPIMCEGLYAEVDKTRESCVVNTISNSIA
ncbi:uncharacterized protein [Diadema setosum]|uniref:uncharacterized protein n=1 Tax=Diadema setosum TaxID=31175 RepID=UPI003B3A4CC9